MVRGNLSFDLECHPAFNYARDKHTTTITTTDVCFDTPNLSLGLVTRLQLEKMAAKSWPKGGTLNGKLSYSAIAVTIWLRQI